MIRGGEDNRQQVNVLITCKGWKRRNAAELHRKEKSGGGGEGGWGKNGNKRRR